MEQNLVPYYIPYHITNQYHQFYDSVLFTLQSDQSSHDTHHLQALLCTGLDLVPLIKFVHLVWYLVCVRFCTIPFNAICLGHGDDWITCAVKL